MHEIQHNKEEKYPLQLRYIYSGKIANRYLLNLWKKSEKITNSYFLNQLYYLNEKIGKTNSFNCLDFVEREGYRPNW